MNVNINDNKQYIYFETTGEAVQSGCPQVIASCTQTKARHTYTKGKVHKKKEKKLTNVSFMYVCVAKNCEMLVFFLFSPRIVRIDNYLSESRF